MERVLLETISREHWMQNSVDWDFDMVKFSKILKSSYQQDVVCGVIMHNSLSNCYVQNMHTFRLRANQEERIHVIIFIY